MLRHTNRLILSFLLSLACSLPALAQENAAPKTSDDAVKVKTTFRSKTLTGMKVRNPEGQELGKIEDIVVDMESRQVRYAALSFGGFLGIGDKLFAVPIEALQLKHDEKDEFFVLDIPKEKLKNAPGFSQNSWPDVGNPRWAAGVDQFYGIERFKTLEGTVAATTESQLKMADAEGKEHTFNLGPNVKIVRNGDEVDLDELAKGERVKVTTTLRDGKQVATSIEATQAARTARQPERTKKDR